MNDPITVLLIDDQAIIAEAVQQMLADETDINFHYCSDPLQTLKAVEYCRPTVILQDLIMPQLEGLLLVRLLRSCDAPTYQIPLIVLSSKEDPITKAQAFEYGANDYLVKLPDRVELLARIRYHSRAYTNLLKRQEAEAQLRRENEEQALYIQQVNKITDAASAVEQNTFEEDLLNSVVERQDELGQLARVFTQMVKTIKVRETELERLKDSLARFFPEEYLRFLRKDSVTDVQLGDFVSKIMAVMFSDIRSFTTISENMTPRENFDFINDYLKQVSPEIRNHYGIIVKFLGDGMMAVFPDGADDAIAAGIAKHQRVWEYNQQRQARGDRPIQIGIGIHVGQMMLGMVGESNRIQGDAFSDNVNLTARLEQLTKVYGSALLITGQVLEHLSSPETYQIRFLANTRVKGRADAIAVYEVLDAEVEAVRDLKLQTLPQFEQGTRDYGDRAFAAARTCFQQVLERHPSDRTAHLYLERIERFLRQGTPEDWQNALSFEHPWEKPAKI